jgi:predicted metal-binding membrane protein
MLAALRSPITVRRFYLGSGILILFAWGLLIAWQRSAYAGLLGHEAVGEAVFPPPVRLGLFLLGWLLMAVAMMLPGSLPGLYQAVQLDRLRRASRRQAWLIIVGYLSPWVLFGLLAYLGDSVLHQLAAPGASLAALSGFIPAAIVLAAGLYQLTPLKRVFLERCQAADLLCQPAQIAPSNRLVSWRQGFDLGILCVGSCWSLMLLMFAVGHHRLDWMLALGGIMAVERLAPWGRRFAWLVGFALIVWSVVWMVGSAHGGHSHV